MTYIPYCYLITHKSTGRRYYGAKVGKSKGNIAHPDKLWVSYFTSSREIKSIIEKEGADAFDFEVRKIFPTAEAAMLWESKFLRKINASKDPKWFNKHNNGEGFYLVGPRTDEHIANLRKNSVSWNVGKKHSETTRAKMREAHNNGKNSVQNIRDNYIKPFAWHIKGNGLDIIVDSLQMFANEYGLKNTVYQAAKNGKPHKGYTFSRIPL